MPSLWKKHGCQYGGNWLSKYNLTGIIQRKREERETEREKEYHVLI